MVERPVKVRDDEFARDNSTPFALFQPLASMFDQFIEECFALVSTESIGVAQQPEPFAATVEREAPLDELKVDAKSCPVSRCQRDFERLMYGTGAKPGSPST